MDSSLCYTTMTIVKMILLEILVSLNEYSSMDTYVYNNLSTL